MTLSSTTNLSSYFSFTLIGTHIHWYCVVPQMGYKHRNRTSIFLNHLLLHNSLNTRSILVWLWSCGVLKVAQMTSLTPPFVWITCFITVSSTDYLFLFSNVSKITDQLFVVKRYRTEVIFKDNKLSFWEIVWKETLKMYFKIIEFKKRTRNSVIFFQLPKV